MIAFDETVDVLVALVDLARPGAEARGHRLAATALRLANRFEVPQRFLRDLELAARLHEVGLLVTRPTTSGDEWQHTVAARSVLARVPRLREPADLIGMISEHWDGSGHPAHRQHGEIPFRSRLLRVSIDFHTALDDAAARGEQLAPSVAVATLTGHSGTWYDPAIVAQLEAMTGDERDAEAVTKIVLPVSELAEGMVLAEDLYTSAGVKLLARGARITQGSLDIILRRDQADPIIAGAWIEFGAASA